MAVDRTDEDRGGQVETNATEWSRRDDVGAYASQELRPPEVMILVRWRDRLSGRVLELGCGGGRVTGYLLQLGGAVHAIDISPTMVEHCRGLYPEGTFEVKDLSDLSSFGDGAFDAIVAPFNVIDVLDDAQRRATLDAMHEILAPGGLLVFSSHNRYYAPRIRRPTYVRTSDPLRLAIDLLRVPGRVRNHRRLSPQQQVTPEYGIFNDEAHDFTLLHYYISRDAQERQLGQHGFELLDCLDLGGRSVGPGETAATHAELHYVAQRR